MDIFDCHSNAMTNTELEKQNAAKAALEYVKNGMVIGLGSGSTSEYMVSLLGNRVSHGLQVSGVASSNRTASLAKSLGIPLINLGEVAALDLYIDGADEVDSDFNMIKGGGGALLREKILAHNSKRNIIIIDSSKKVQKLGVFKLPVEIIPFSHKSISEQFRKMGLNPVLRENGNQIYSTDENNFILDTDIRKYPEHDLLNKTLLAIPGVVETGLFINYVDILIMGNQALEKIEIFHHQRS